MVINYLIAMCVIAVLNACVLSVLYRKRLNYFFTGVFYFIVVANFGHLFLALSTTLEGAVIANKACYLGSCFLPMFIFFTIMRLCNFRFPKLGKVLLVLFSVVVFALSCTVGYSDIYYKSISYVSRSGVGSYVVEYGPAHVLWNILLIGYAVADIVAIVVVSIKKCNVSYKNLIALAFLMFISLVSFVIMRNMDNDMILMPLVYIIDEIVLLYICVQIKMYDISNSVMDVLEAENVCAYLAFSLKGRFLGCNKIAMEYFPELRNYRIDYDIPENAEVGKIIKSWIQEYANGKDLSYMQFIYMAHHYKVEFRDLYQKTRSRMCLFRIEDETEVQSYIKRLDTSNMKLEQLVKDNSVHIQAIQKQMIIGMAMMVENRDSNTGGHIKRTSQVVEIIANEMQKDSSLSYSKNFYDSVIAASPMHDLGKIAIDDKILRKPGKFTPEEFEVMKTHAVKGCTIVQNLLSGVESPFFVEIAKNIACFHHERWDGSGYPYGLMGNKIPLEARIMAVADVYDALVSKRCYKAQLSFEEASKIIMESMGSHFDPCLKKYFMACRERLEIYYQSVAH